MTKDSTAEAYGDQEVVEHYVREDLQAPEQRVLEDFAEKLKGAKMLDIGVGAGRTTYSFGPAVGEYIGSDYSEEMIAKCRDLFGEKYRFEVVDVRDLSAFAEGEFDFVLFSYNGLGNVNPEERIGALGEIRRILKPGGVFCFSSHNMRLMERLYHFRRSFNPFISLRRWKKHRKLVKLNGTLAELLAKESAYVHDGTHDFRIKNYFIHPGAQVRQLKDAGFEDVVVYGLEDGEPVAGEENLAAMKDDWIYYTAVRA